MFLLQCFQLPKQAVILGVSYFWPGLHIIESVVSLKEGPKLIDLLGRRHSAGKKGR
jgi:hypothetical protein